LVIVQETIKNLGSWEELDYQEKECRNHIIGLENDIADIQAKKAEIEKLKPVWESEKGTKLFVSERVAEDVKPIEKIQEKEVVKPDIEPDVELIKEEEQFEEPAELSNEEVII
jgi:hypothetical protein